MCFCYYFVLHRRNTGWLQIAMKRLPVLRNLPRVTMHTVPVAYTRLRYSLCTSTKTQLLARDSKYDIARYMPSPVRLSVRHTGGSVKDG